MNDFYGPRRTIIADVAGLVGMALAGMASSALVWDTLANGFKTGRLERAFAVFLAVVLTSAAAGGLAGLAIGRRIGAAWERRHRAHRAPPGEGVPSASPGPTAPSRAPDPGTPSRVVPGIRLAPVGADVASLLSLLQRAGLPDEPHSADVLRRSVGIGAWEGARLVGIVRVVTDGRAGLVRSLVVDPVWRRRGLGRELTGAAQAACGGGPLTFAAVPDAARPFVESLGAVPAPGAWRLDVPPVSAPGA